MRSNHCLPAVILSGAVAITACTSAFSPERAIPTAEASPAVVAGERPPIIDMHLHALPLGALSPEQTTTGLMAPETTEDLRRETLAALERHNVVLAVTSGPEVESYHEAAPQQILRGCGFSGHEDMDQLRARITSGECQVLAESAPQYAGMAPNDPRLEPYFALAEEMDVPVGLHMGLGPEGAAYRGMPNYRIALGNPLLLEDVLVRHPDLRLYVMHAGWPMLDEMLGLLHAYPQVYVDVSVINWVLPREEFYTYLERLVNAGYGERILYGSDQMFWPEGINRSVEAIQEAPFLTKEQKRDIFYSNAVRFLRIEAEPSTGS